MRVLILPSTLPSIATVRAVNERLDWRSRNGAVTSHWRLADPGLSLTW